MRFRSPTAALLGSLLLLAACRPDQVEHLSNTKEIAKEAANWEVKRIMPNDLLHATRWAGDTLTQTADSALVRVMTEKLKSGGLTTAFAYCRPETYPAIDSMARELHATAHRVSLDRRTAQLTSNDTARLLRRESAETFFYQRPVVISNALCLRCHGVVGQTISPADNAIIQKLPALKTLTGFELGQPIGAWQVRFERGGVAEFYTMKTRKVHKRRF